MRNLSDDEIQILDRLRELEAMTGAYLDQALKHDGVSARHIAIARTNLEQAGLWAKRAIEGA